eukprot:433742-Amphidinium_carterae.1
MVEYNCNTCSLCNGRFQLLGVASVVFRGFNSVALPALRSSFLFGDPAVDQVAVLRSSQTSASEQRDTA